MANSVNVYDESYAAFGDLRSNQFFFVEFKTGTDKIVQLCSAVVAVACGVLQNNPQSGEAACVRHMGRAKALVNCVSISTAGYMIGTTALGGADVKLASVAASGQYVNGISIESAVTSGGLCEVILNGAPVQLGG